MLFLKQSTAVTVKIGPFVDDADGKTAETGLTLAQADVRLAKNGGDMAQKNESSSCTHDENGIYDCPLDATDMGTLGRLQLFVHESGALPVWHELMVLPASVFDAWFGSDRQQVDVAEIGGSAVEHSGGFVKVKDASGNDVAPDADADEILTRLPDATPGASGGLPTVDADNRVAGIQGTANTLDDLHDFDPAAEDVSLSDTDLDDLKDSIKGSPDGKTVKEAYDKAEAARARVDALVGTPVVTDTAISGTEQDIARYRGDTAPITFDLARDITAASLLFTVKRRHSDAQGAALITKSSAQSSEIEITDAEAGEFVVKLLADDTSGLLPDGRSATFVYDVEMTLDGAIETVAAGDFVLVPDVTTGS